jgi:hypothetical protein
MQAEQEDIHIEPRRITYYGLGGAPVQGYLARSRVETDLEIDTYVYIE